MQAFARKFRPAVALGFALSASLSPFLFAENINTEEKAWYFDASSVEVLSEEVTALPVDLPVVITPVVNVQAAPAAMKVRVPREMQKLALKYDVTKIGERKVGTGMNFYSLDTELKMGQEMSQEAEQGLVLVSDPIVTEYINRLAQNLVRNSDAKVPFTVKVVRDEEVNAYALPGGYMYVNTGLVLAADNEAELAGVLAHEIAHVAARHATHNMSRRDLFNLCSIPAVFVAGPAGMAIREVTEIALPVEFMKFSRDAEREADLLGMEYAYAAGYDPAEMVNFFEKVQAEEKHKKGFLARAFDSHPMTEERVKRAQEEMAWMLPPREDYVVTTSEFGDVKARLSAIVNHHLVFDAKPDKPVLRKSAEEDGPPVLRKTSGK